MPVAPAPARPFVPAGRLRRGAPPWVLMYRSVSETADDPYRVTVSPSRLHRQLRWLRLRGLRGVGVGTLLRARAAGQDAGLVGLTFDDGYADFLTEALPLLRRHDCTATVFVLPGRLGGENVWDPMGPRRPLLDEAGVRAVAAAGMEIGSRGLLHRDLVRADATVLRRETAHSRELLTALTGRVPDGFCYPYGTLDARAVAAVRAAGYGYACGVSPGRFTGRHALPRVRAGAADTAWRLSLKRALHPLRHRPVRLDAPAAADLRTGTGTGAPHRPAPTHTVNAPTPHGGSR